MDGHFRIDSTKKVIATICLSASAICFISVALFVDRWWEQYSYASDKPYNRMVTRYTLWETVECTDGKCIRQSTDSTGWIIFTRLMGVSGLLLCCVSFLVQIIFLITEKPVLKFIAVCCSGVNGGVLFLTALVVTGELSKITKSIGRGTLDMTPVLRFGTLPLGMLYLCSLTTTVTAIFLVVNLSRSKK